MRSAAATVDEFLQEQPEPLRKDLEQLRALVRSEAPDALEAMKYGMPSYHREGAPMFCAYNAQKNYLAFYVGRVPDTFREPMKASGFSMGKGCVRFGKLDPAKLDILRNLLREVMAHGIVC